MQAIKGMSESQAALGHTVSIVATRTGKEPSPALPDVALYLYPCEFVGWRWSKGLADALHSQIKKAEIVHIHTVWEYPTWIGAKVCQDLGKPYIIRPCGMLEQWSLAQSSLKKKLYLLLGGSARIKRAAAMHFTSESERIKSIRPTKAFVLPIGLPPSAYEDLPSASAFRQRFPILEDRKIVLFLGRLHYKKQPDVAIRAFALACRKYRDHTLVLAGPGDVDYVAGLRQLACQLGIENQVVFVGLLQEEAVREAYRAAALFVLPSLQENFGISVAEAMAAGCPVLVSDQVSLSKEVARAGAGIVCGTSVEQVAAAMSAFFHALELQAEMGVKGRELILSQFTWEKIASDLIDVYSDILINKYTHPAWTH